jgi:branched-chain amino acid transport system substrate-binding protein
MKMLRQQNGIIGLTLLVLLGLSLVYVITSRGLAKQTKIARSEHDSNLFRLGIVWPVAAQDLFIEGALLAVEEINKRGGLVGRQIEPVIRDETIDFEAALAASRSLVADPSIKAVIGHSDDSNASIAASVLYDASNMLFISPGTSSRLFILHDFKRTFQTVADDHEVGRAMAVLCRERGHKRVALIYERAQGGRSIAYGESLAQAFLAEVPDQELEIGILRSFSAKQARFITLISEIRAADVDVVVVASLAPAVKKLIQQAQRLRYEVPLLGGDRLETTDLAQSKDVEVSGLTIVSQGGDLQHGDRWHSFQDRFRARWDKEPSSWSGKAYDAVWLLHRSSSIAGGLNVNDIAAVLRSTGDWEGVEGNYTFNPEGDLVSGTLHLKVIQNGRWTLLSKLS